MSIIQVSQLTFAYEGSDQNIFENASFQLDTDWRLGFIGRNGRGKTTLLNLLRGLYPYSGTISASVQFEYFPFDVPDATRDTECIVRDVVPSYVEWMLARELTLLDVFPSVLSRPFCTLSSGEQTKVLLAALFLRENSFLLIDEPTNHLDLAGRALVSAYLRTKHGFILVSHDRVFLDDCIDHVLSINRADIELQKGNFSSWLVNKQRRDSFELAAHETLKKDIKRLSAAAKRASAWSDATEKTKFGTKNSGLRPDKGFIGHKSAKMMKRAKSISARRESAVEEKSTLLKNIETADALKLSPLHFPAKYLAELLDVSISYGDDPICAPARFTIQHGDRVALCGKNGCGKSSMLKLLCGEPLAYTGTMHVGSGLRISYVPQETAHLRGGLSDFARENALDESLFKTLLRKLDFSRAQFDTDMADLSGGQKKKVLLARSLCAPAHLYIWDEPLNFVDVLSRMQIESLILQYQPTLLFVEHDSAFCNAVATKRVQLA